MAEFAPTVPRFEKNVYAFWCHDGPNAERLREEHLDGHLHHVEKNHENYIIAGPLSDTDAPNINASFFLIIAETEEAAWAIAKDDPYFSSDLYENITVRKFTPAVGRFIGGVTWESAEAVRAYATQTRTAETA